VVCCVVALELFMCARSDRQEPRDSAPAPTGAALTGSERPAAGRDDRGASPTCVQRVRDVEAMFATRNRCKQASDCALVWPQCPFGCYGAIERSQVEELFRKIREYQRYCTNCHYRCTLLQSKDATCEQGVCRVPEQ
jgi:hypothetical protein